MGRTERKGKSINWGIAKGSFRKIILPTTNKPKQNEKLQKAEIWAILTTENPQVE